MAEKVAGKLNLDKIEALLAKEVSDAQVQVSAMKARLRTSAEARTKETGKKNEPATVDDTHVWKFVLHGLQPTERETIMEACIEAIVAAVEK